MWKEEKRSMEEHTAEGCAMGEDCKEKIRVKNGKEDTKIVDTV